MLPIVRICPNVHKFVQQLTADTRYYIGNFW